MSRPLWGCTGHGTLSIVDFSVASDASGKFGQYTIEVNHGGRVFNVFRRYSHFQHLQNVFHKSGKVDHAALEKLHFPPASVSVRKKLDDQFLEKRRVLLQEYLRGVLAPGAHMCTMLDDFFSGDKTPMLNSRADAVLAKQPLGGVPSLCLIGRYPEPFRDREFWITAEGGTVGSSLKSIVSVQDELRGVSRLHARVQYSRNDDKYYICDNCSLNGSRVIRRGTHIAVSGKEYIPLEEGDTLIIAAIGFTISREAVSDDVPNDGFSAPVEGAAKQGLLMKRGLRKLFGSVWDERFCTLTADCISYARPQDPFNPRGSIMLADITDVVVSSDPKIPSDTEGFDIVTKSSRTYTFYGRTKHLTRSWVEAIRALWEVTPQSKARGLTELSTSGELPSLKTTDSDLLAFKEQIRRVANEALVDVLEEGSAENVTAYQWKSVASAVHREWLQCLQTTTEAFELRLRMMLSAREEREVFFEDELAALEEERDHLAKDNKQARAGLEKLQQQHEILLDSLADGMAPPGGVVLSAVEQGAKLDYFADCKRNACHLKTRREDSYCNQHWCPGILGSLGCGREKSSLAEACITCQPVQDRFQALAVLTCADCPSGVESDKEGICTECAAPTAAACALCASCGKALRACNVCLEPLLAPVLCPRVLPAGRQCDTATQEGVFCGQHRCSCGRGKGSDAAKCKTCMAGTPVEACVECSAVAEGRCLTCTDPLCVACFEVLHRSGSRARHHHDVTGSPQRSEEKRPIGSPSDGPNGTPVRLRRSAKSMPPTRRTMSTLSGADPRIASSAPGRDSLPSEMDECASVLDHGETEDGDVELLKSTCMRLEIRLRAMAASRQSSLKQKQALATELLAMQNQNKALQIRVVQKLRDHKTKERQLDRANRELRARLGSVERRLRLCSDVKDEEDEEDGVLSLSTASTASLQSPLSPLNEQGKQRAGAGMGPPPDPVMFRLYPGSTVPPD